MNRWNPFREIDDFVQTYQRMLAPNRTHSSMTEQGKEQITRAEWLPAVDISESENAYLVKAELPEVRKEDIKLTVHDRVLMLSGERKLEKQENGIRHHRIERVYGSFARSFSLPEDANEAEVKADYKEGVLLVTIGKMTRPQPRTVDIGIGV